MLINNQTRLHMVIGHPLTHTLSPLLHNTVYAQKNINAVLLAFANPKLAVLIPIIKELSVGITAVTMPFKEEVLSYLDHVSAEVKLLQAANTIIQRQEKLYGFNTDVAGIAYALRHTHLAEQRVLILGAGGAARAAAYFLQQQKAKLFFLNRNEQRARHLVAAFGGQLIAPDELKQIKLDIIVNTTPVGMYPDVKNTPLNNYHFHPEQTVFDMIYNPSETELLKHAKAMQAMTITGVDMFIGQGLRQIELWMEENIYTEQLATHLKNVILGVQA